MAEYTALAPLFTDIANAIRSKTGETGAITANTFPEEIINISGKRALIATSTFSINIGPLSKEYQISAPIQTSKNLTVELILPVNF